MKDAILKIHPALVLAICGAVTAYINVVLMKMLPDGPSIHPGFIFGAAVAGYLYLRGMTASKSGVVFLAFGASWLAALYFGIWIYDSSYLVVGIVSGALGALIVLGGFALVLPGFRDWKRISIITLVGLVAGGIALPLSEQNELLLMLIWQPVFGAALGWRREWFETPVS